MCLDISPIVEPENDQRPSLIGKVNRELVSEQPLWVRLVGLYFDFNATETVEKESLTENGVFRFVGLRPARYLLMLYGMNGIKISREVDVRAFDTYITIGEQEITAPPR
jgi:hypothetical protein